MMTDESTMMPKSTAPMESRLADFPRRKSTAKANSSASGMLTATIRAPRTLREEHEQHQRHQPHAGQQVFPHGVGRDVNQVGAVVVGR